MTDRFDSLWRINIIRLKADDWLTNVAMSIIRGTQRQFSENICSEDDLWSSIFETFVVKFIAYLVPPRIFKPPKNGIIAHF